MPLPESVARKPLHVRNILCEGDIRDDGLRDIEARLLDLTDWPDFYRGEK